MKIVKVPSSQGSLGKNEGTEKAPDKIVNLLKKLSMYVNEDGKNIDFEIDEVKVNPSNIEETNKRIYEKAKQGANIFIGGDHSITFSTFSAFAEKYKNPGIIIFDAHPDAVNNFEPASHEDFVKVLIEKKILKKENLIMVGLRSADKIEREFLEKNKIKAFWMKGLHDNMENACDHIMAAAKEFDGLYLSIDIDVLDAAFCPGTGYPEPFGMTSRELMYFLRRIKKLKNLKCIDLVEVNPVKDVNDLTSKIAAKIIHELI